MCGRVYKHVRIGIIHDHASLRLKMMNFEFFLFNFVIFDIKSGSSVLDDDFGCKFEFSIT